MQGIPLNERKRLGALLDDRPQTEVMAMIPQFSQAETDNGSKQLSKLPREVFIPVSTVTVKSSYTISKMLLRSVPVRKVSKLFRTHSHWNNISVNP